LLGVLGLAAPVAAEPDIPCSSEKWGPKQCIRPAHFVYDTCQAIEVFATRFGLDPHFFARLIWQESRFDPNAVSPVGAQGIAQFMSYTAARRGLSDPFNPALALEHSAEYLAEMQARYGNAGLAAVGYNGGERRAEGIIAGTGGLMPETVNYVAIITGMTWKDWLQEGAETPDFTLAPDLPFREACYDLAHNRRYTPMPEPEPLVKPWGVQVAFGVSKSAAETQYKQRMRRCAALVEDETPSYVQEKTRASPTGNYYLARIGRDDREAAWELCRKMKARGCLCAVYKNKG